LESERRTSELDERGGIRGGLSGAVIDGDHGGDMLRGNAGGGVHQDHRIAPAGNSEDDALHFGESVMYRGLDVTRGIHVCN
jgi:hypothetical protein